MPWCPECKVEYVKGKTVCVDCGSALVESLEEAKEPIKFLETEKELFAKKFVDFLKYSKVPNVSYEYNETDKKWVVFIDESAKKQVVKLYDAFYSVEITGISEEALTSEKQKENKEYVTASSLEDEAEDYETIDNSSTKTTEEETDGFTSLFDEEELENIIESRKPKTYIPPAYVKKEDQFRDLKSTAFTFFFVSLLGIGVLVLNAAGVISLFAGIMPYIVMGGLFAAFLYIGFTTYAKSKRVEKEISSENNLTQSIEKWLNQNITKADLDSIDAAESNSEISFFKKLDYMKELIINEFGDINEGYLDQLVEEYYNTHFEVQND